MLVEDNPGDILLFKRAFNEFDERVEVRVFGSGPEAANEIRSFSKISPIHFPDLILLDISLPKVSGFDLLKELKASKLTRHIPVIMFTSSDAESDVQTALAMHANSYLLKPATFEEMLAIVFKLGEFWLQTAYLRIHAGEESF
ncbi:MAG: response regulator [Opitutales bacterium]